MTTYLLLILGVFQFKHLIADYFLQTEYMLGKFRPDWGFLKPLLAHVGVHAAWTFSICSFFGAHVEKAAALALLDATIHFFMDRLKAGPKYMGRWKALSGAEYMHIMSYKDTVGLDQFKPQMRGDVWFWRALGIDQAVHHLTDLAVVWFLVNP